MESVLDSIAPTAPTASIDLDLVTGQYHDWHNQLVIPAIAGTRIVTCLYQVNKTTGKKLKESSYVRIPTAHLTDQTVKDNMSELLPFVTAYLQEVEDKIIKDEHKVGLTCVYSSSLSIAKIIDRLEADSTSGRLSKEVIQTWFADEILEKLAMIRISGEARQMLDVILRKTYGWGKKMMILPPLNLCNLRVLKRLQCIKPERNYKI